MPIFLTIKNAAGSKSSMLASSLGADPNFPGNLIATGVSDCHAELNGGKRLRVDAWSFKISDLDSYMVGELEADLMSMVGGMAGAMAQAAELSQTGTAPEEPVEALPSDEAPSQDTPVTKKKRK